MRSSALIHSRAQTAGVSVRDFGRPVAARAAAVKTNTVGIEIRPARDIIEHRIPESLAVLRSRKRSVGHAGHVDAKRRQTGLEIRIARPLFLEGVDASPNYRHRRPGNTLGLAE